MAFDPLSPATFTVNITGETTFQSYPGTFKVKKLLHHGDQVEVDRMRRQLLGALPEGPSPRAVNQTGIFAELLTRIVEAPKWWTENGNGMALYDDNVLKKVYEETMKAEQTFREEIKKLAEADKKDLEALKKE